MFLYFSVKKAAPAPERTVTAEAPRFVELLQGQIVSDGDAVTLVCRISGKYSIIFRVVVFFNQLKFCDLFIV